MVSCSISEPGRKFNYIVFVFFRNHMCFHLVCDSTYFLAQQLTASVTGYWEINARVAGYVLVANLTC